MTGSALYKKDKRQRCNGIYQMQLKPGDQYFEDTTARFIKSSVQQKPATGTPKGFPASGTFVHLIKEEIMGDQLYKFTLSKTDKGLSFNFISINRPLCEVKFGGLLAKVSDEKYAFEDKKMGLKFEAISSGDSLIIQPYNTKCSVGNEGV